MIGPRSTESSLRMSWSRSARSRSWSGCTTVSAWCTSSLCRTTSPRGLMIWAPWESAVPATPGAVREQARTSTSVLVQGAPSTTGPAVDHYLILRDGTEIVSVPGTVTSYRDTGLSPATVYEYRVVAVSGDVRSAPSSVLLVKTLLPPI